MHTASARAMIGLREMILTGQLAPGQRLTEAQLSSALDLSRTPLREAVLRLQQEGLLERVGAGHRVRVFTRRDVVDGILLRGVLEGTAARLAAERGVDPTILADAWAAVAALDRAIAAGPDGLPDTDAYAAGNARFHNALARSSGSRILAEQIAQVARRPFASPSAFMHGRADRDGFDLSLRSAQSGHHAILEAIEAREGSRAEALGREHARVALGNLERALRQSPDPDDILPSLARFAC